MLLHSISLYFTYSIYTPIYILYPIVHYTNLFYCILITIRLCIFGTLLYFILYYFILSNACYSAYFLYHSLSLLLYCITLHLSNILRFILS